MNEAEFGHAECPQHVSETRDFAHLSSPTTLVLLVTRKAAASSPTTKSHTRRMCAAL